MNDSELIWHILMKHLERTALIAALLDVMFYCDMCCAPEDILILFLNFISRH